MKDIFKNWLKGFAVLFSLSAIIAGIMSCEGSDKPEEQLSSELVTLRVFAQKSARGAYQFVEWSSEFEPRDLVVKSTFSIKGFDGLYREGTEYIISARKVTSKENGSVTYNYIKTLSESSEE